MKKPSNTKGSKGAKKTQKPSSGELRKPSKLKPIKNKETKKSKNPKVFDEDEEELLPDDDLLGFDNDFDSGSDFEEDDY